MKQYFHFSYKCIDELYCISALHLLRLFLAVTVGLDILAVAHIGWMMFIVMVMRQTLLNVTIEDGGVKTVVYTRQPKLSVPVISFV